MNNIFQKKYGDYSETKILDDLRFNIDSDFHFVNWSILINKILSKDCIGEQFFVFIVELYIPQTKMPFYILTSNLT